MWKYTLLFLPILIIAGCFRTMNSSATNGTLMKSPERIITQQTEKEYQLQVGDRIEIKFFYNPELNETLRLSPDGRISLQGIDDLIVSGFTASELEDVLTEKYSRLIRHPDISVIIRDFNPLGVYVGGEINSPGFVPIHGRISALQAIIMAGGLKETAEIKSVVVLRNQGTKEPLFLTLNLKEDLEQTDIKEAKRGSTHEGDSNFERNTRNDILLRPYDLIFIPKTKVAKLNQFVEQYIENLIPVSLTAGYSWVYDLNPERN